MKKFLLLSLVLHSLLFLELKKVPVSKSSGAGNAAANNRVIVPFEIQKTSKGPGTGPKPSKNKKCPKWYSGIGIALQSDLYTIKEVFPGYPAAKAGLLPRDKIISIESQTGPVIEGPLGTKVVLTILRGKTLIFELTRAKICIVK